MSTVSAVRAGLATRIATISGLEVHSTVPTTPQVPSVLVQATGGDYDLTMADGGETWRFDLVLLAIQAATPWDVAQDAIDDYLARTGTASIKAAIEGDVTLGGVAHSTRVLGWSDYGTISMGGVEYFGARLRVEVWPT